jgi:hypothetical protein
MGASSDSGAGRPLTFGQGPGWAQLATAVAAQVPPAENETIDLFPPKNREGCEWGTAVVTRRAEEGSSRLRVYTARYKLIVRGKERGRWKGDVAEVALSPAEVLAQVMQAAGDRSGDPEPPVIVERSAWYEG